MNKKWGNIDPDFDNDNTINGWKLKVLDVEFFRLERPNMSSFDTDEIQTAINSSLALLDAECNGLIQEVWFITDVESKFYRTGKEKNYIREAAIMQTQYFINLGNDYTDGSTSFNASGISASFQRPLDKKNIAPGVFILLQKGRVYELQSYDLGGNNFGKKPTANSLVNYVQFGVGDVRYVSYNQMPYNRQEGSLLYVEKGEIKFFTVEQLDLTVPRAYLLWDKATKSFEDIHDVKDIAFFGNQLDNAITRQEAEELIAASPSGVSKEYVDDGLNLKANKTDIDTINVELEVNSTNISDNAANIANKQDKLIAGTNITIVGDTISSSGGTTNGVTLDTDQTITGRKTFTKAITITGATTMNGLRLNGTLNMGFSKIFNVGAPINDGDAATKKYVDDNVLLKQNKLTAGTNITIVGDTISSSGGTTNGVTLDTDQTITGEKTFTKAIRINGSDGKKYFFDTNAAGSLSFSAPNRISNIVGGNNIIGFYADGYIRCFNNRIIEVGTPTANTDAANKKYVDDNVLLKQNKLTAGTGIDITGDVISSTGGATGDVTLDTDQTITGIKTFTNGIKNNLVEVDGKSLIIKNSNTSASYLEIESVYSGSGYKNWFGIQLFRTTGTSRPRLANLEIRQDDGLYIDSVNDLSFSANNIKFGNARLQGVRTPAADDDAATKKYADDGLALKQNTLTAGTGIDITGDVISSTGGAAGVTLDTAQTISGTKTFSNKTIFNNNLDLSITGNTAGFIEIKKDGSRLAYFGKGNSALNQITLSAENNNLVITGGNVYFNGKRLQQVADPVNNSDSANKRYVDTEIAKALKPYKKFIEKLMKET